MGDMGKDWSTWVVGKVPAGQLSGDVFVMKARLLAGFADQLKDKEFGWFTQEGDEIEQVLGAEGREYYQEIKDLL
jgi:hypothetical protein